ncbi:MAG: hypothetical protein Q4P32_06445 [Micrococcales bacterium]|nr:hypothetical protein [Micrococcales bacterium]
MDGPEVLDDAVEQLYASSPDQFVAERKRLAALVRSRGDRALATQIAALRKPTMSAWAVNAAVRTRADLVADLVGFSASMRSAQSGLDGSAIRDLSRGREDLLGRLSQGVQAAADDVGRQLGAALLAETRATFVAAIADPQAQLAVTSGCLTRALSYSGFGEVDLDEALAASPPIRVGGARAPCQASGTRGAAQPHKPGLQGDSRAHGGDAAEHRRRGEERAQRERHLALTVAQDRLGEAERVVTGLSLALAEAVEVARRAAARHDELARLLERAAREAQGFAGVAQSASAELAQARAVRDAARDEVDRLS